MSCWRVLELSEQPDDTQIPQLLVKPVFHADSYIVHLTDLSSIWCEELSPDNIVARASNEQSPIEVTKYDTAQLAILLDNVKKPLENSNDATCRITRTDMDGLTLHTSISLPKPLDRLNWKFHLQKRTSATLKNELILPLLVSSHIQHERINSLIATIVDKDRAITRLVDQYESNNLDLATAFPSIGGVKAGRKLVKREQAAKHVSALRAFRKDLWREETEQLEESNVITFGLFQEALAQSTPKVPAKLMSDNNDRAWWSAVSTRLIPQKSAAKKATTPVLSNKPVKAVVESSGDETEDEFETHHNFKLRAIGDKSPKAAEMLQTSAQVSREEDEAESTEEEDDLDAVPKSQNQRRSHPTPLPRKEPNLSASPSPIPATPPNIKSKAKGFRIDGRTRKATESPRSLPEASNVRSSPDVLPTRESVPPSSQADLGLNETPKKARRAFKIGGKGKVANDEASQRAITAVPSTNRIRATMSPTAEPPSSPPIPRAAKELTPVKEAHEETPEEKAERKRSELKRKNEEAAKKQAQAKKKKRF